LDVDPKMAKWGSRGHHVIAPIGRATAYFRQAMFDTVVLNGVFGYGLDEASAQAKAIEECAKILKPGGLLVIGWNFELVDDPSTLSETKRYFRTASETGAVDRVTFRPATHVFDFYVRYAVAAFAMAISGPYELPVL
jgi:SAM-dependent methyltransferase